MGVIKEILQGQSCNRPFSIFKWKTRLKKKNGECCQNVQITQVWESLKTQKTYKNNHMTLMISIIEIALNLPVQTTVQQDFLLWITSSSDENYEEKESYQVQNNYQLPKHYVAIKNADMKY